MVRRTECHRDAAAREEGGLGDFIEALRSRRAGAVMQVQDQALAAARAHEALDRSMEKAIPRRLIELDGVDRVGGREDKLSKQVVRAETGGAAS
jgi:hypothetical protein